MTHRERLEKAINNMEKTSVCLDVFDRAIAEQRAEIERQAELIAALKEWKQIVLGTGTDQEAVIRMAAAEYTQVAIQTWKAANEKQAQEIAALKVALRELHAVVKGECPSLLDEDSGGLANLDMQIDELLKKEHS